MSPYRSALYLISQTVTIMRRAPPWDTAHPTTPPTCSPSKATGPSRREKLKHSSTRSWRLRTRPLAWHLSSLSQVPNTWSRERLSPTWMASLARRTTRTVWCQVTQHRDSRRRPTSRWSGRKPTPSTASVRWTCNLRRNGALCRP